MTSVPSAILLTAPTDSTPLACAPVADRPLISGKTIPALDAVRGIAILLVMGFHFTVMSSNSSPVSALLCKVAVLGRCGVDLFFVLSGFLITGILYDAKNSPSYFRTFYARRILRIFPLYYGTLALLVISVPLATGKVLLGTQPAVAHQGWLWAHSANIGLIYGWLTGDNDYLGGLGHLWSLGVEEHFYLLWPLVIFFFQRKTLIKICGALALAAFLFRVALMVSGDNQPMAYLLTPSRFDQLALGGMAALIGRGPRGLRPLVQPARWLAPASFIALLVVLLGRDRLHTTEHVDVLMPTIGYSVLAIGFASCIVLAVTARAGSFLHWFGTIPILRTFGKYSYSMYIFHPMLFDAVLRNSPAMPVDSLHFMLSYFCVGMLAMLISFNVSLLTWHAFEKHFLKLKRHFEHHKPAPIHEPALAAA